MTAEAVLLEKAPSAQVGALLTALHAKGETAEELSSFVEVIRQAAPPSRLDQPLVLDICGTGGGSPATFNISTAAAFVVAGAGIPVLKLARRETSDRTGSAECLAALGLPVAASAREAAAALAAAGAAFVAPAWSAPPLARIAALRRDIGIPTLLDLLPILIHPAGVTHRMIGVANPRHIEPVARVSATLGHTRVLVLHGMGIDEVTLEGETRCYEFSDRHVRGLKIDPLALGFSYASAASLRGEDSASGNAELLERILLDEERSPRRDAVILNAAVGIWVAGRARFLGEGVQTALSTLANGKAHAVLRTLRNFFQER